MADDTHQLVGAGQIDQNIHSIIDGSAVQRSKAFVDEQCIHLDASLMHGHSI